MRPDPHLIPLFVYEFYGAGQEPFLQITDNSSTGAGKTVVFGYDGLNRLLSASTTVASSTPFLQTFTYSSLGNITELRTNPNATSTYTYAGTAHANPHAPTLINGVSLSYDNNGNLTAYGTSTYTWDYLNRITQAGTGSATSTYAYDYTGSRVTQTIGGITTKYASRLYNTNGATTTKYVYAGDTLIATVEKVGVATTTHIIHPDHLGGTNVVTDANGDVSQTLDYYPFGSIRLNTKTSDFDERKKFIGEHYDSEVGLSYLNARYYDGGRGQFLSQDTAARDNPNQFLQDPQQLNYYAYARNNPLRYTDPNGKSINDQIANIQKQIDNIQAQLNAYKEQLANKASNIVLSVGTSVQNYSQGSGVLNQTVNALTRDNTAAYVAGGIGLAAGGTAAILAYGAATVVTTAVTTATQVPSGITETAQRIAGHAVQRGHFPGETLQGTAQIIEDTMLNPTTVRLLEKGRVGFFNGTTGMNVIFNPNVPYLGTAVKTLADPKGVGYWFFNKVY